MARTAHSGFVIVTPVAIGAALRKETIPHNREAAMNATSASSPRINCEMLLHLL